MTQKKSIFSFFFRVLNKKQKKRPILGKKKNDFVFFLFFFSVYYGPDRLFQKLLDCHILKICWPTGGQMFRLTFYLLFRIYIWMSSSILTHFDLWFFWCCLKLAISLIRTCLKVRMWISMWVSKDKTRQKQDKFVLWNPS